MSSRERESLNRNAWTDELRVRRALPENAASRSLWSIAQ